MAQAENVPLAYRDSRLYSTLQKKLPSEFIYDGAYGGRINTRKLADAMGVARFSIYRWFTQDTLSKAATKKLLVVSDNAQDEKDKGRLSKEDLLPFVMAI